MGEAANPEDVETIRQSIKAHPNVVEVVNLLTMHLAPKQILVNANVNLKNELTNEEIIKTIADVEEKIKAAEPMVDMIFLETASLKEGEKTEVNPRHIG